MRVGLFFGLGVGLGNGLGIGPNGGLLFGFIFGLGVGLGGGLSVGLDAFIQHFILRIFLWCTNRLPWNLIPFLDEAVERLLLRKVGGSYIFVHRLLLEYFTTLGEPTSTEYPFSEGKMKKSDVDM